MLSEVLASDLWDVEGVSFSFLSGALDTPKQSLLFVIDGRTTKIEQRNFGEITQNLISCSNDLNDAIPNE